MKGSEPGPHSQGNVGCRDGGWGEWPGVGRGEGCGARSCSPAQALHWLLRQLRAAAVALQLQPRCRRLPEPLLSVGGAILARLQPARTAWAAPGMQHYPQSMDHYVINKRKVVLQMRLSYRSTTRRRSISPLALTRADRCRGRTGAGSEQRPGSQQGACAPPAPAAGAQRWKFHNIEPTESERERGGGCLLCLSGRALGSQGSW